MEFGKENSKVYFVKNGIYGEDIEIGKCIVESKGNISYIENISTLIGFILADIPKINIILNIFEPTTFPIAIPFSPFPVATKLVTSSGREVPTATIVSPIKVSDNPN